MTVFGFGRKGIVKYLDKVPRRFSLGFVESSEHQIISDKIQEILNINPNY
jgi:hypothetical protein